MPVKKYNSAIEAMQAVSSIGQKTKVISIDNGFTITICSLGAQLETDSFIECMNFWGQAFIYKHKLETLSRCIIAINDQNTSEILLDERKQIIGSWSQGLVDNLYKEYAKLLGSVDEYLEKIKLTAQTNVIGVRDAEKVQQKDLDEEKKDE